LVDQRAFAIGAGLVLCCQTSLLMFMPQRVDHHGWQLAFLVLTVAGLSDPKRVRGGLTMGLSSAASLVIGLELIPFLAICGAAAALRWVWTREETARLRAYGFALAIGCGLGYLGFTSRDSSVWRCDALSPVWLSTMVAAGLLAAAISLLTTENRWLRLAAAAVCGAALTGGYALAFPQCLGRPEQVSPELYRLWLSNVREAKPLYVQPWTTVLTVISLPIVGVVGSVWATRAAWGTRKFEAWLPVALISVVSLLLLLWQTRTGPAAQLMAVPGAAALAWAFIPRLSRSGSMLVRTLGVVAAFLIVSGLGLQLIVNQVPGKPDSARMKAINRANGRCPMLQALRPIARLPATTIFTFVDMGPRLITVTHHKAVAGPYHRNGDAILDVHHAFDGAPENARAIMLRHGATLLMTCPNMSESTVYRARSPNGFYSRLAKGERFDWLIPVALPKGSPLLLWKIS
nr:AcrB/AcrD/AcrF family protein [Sphingomonadaceae bacterium]